MINSSGFDVIAIGPPNVVFASPLCKNFIIFAWEFPDIPSRQINGEPKNNWIKQLQLYDEIYTLSDFATSVVRRHYPTNSFTLPVNFLQFAENLKHKPFVEEEIQILSVADELSSLSKEDSLESLMLDSIRRSYRIYLKKIIPKFLHKLMVSVFNLILKLRNYFSTQKSFIPDLEVRLISEFSEGSTIVASWLNPFDSRKNFIVLPIYSIWLTTHFYISFQEWELCPSIIQNVFQDHYHQTFHHTHH
jgi:hypothetical protein